MISIIFISILLIAVTTLMLSRRSRRPSIIERSAGFEPRSFEGLFAEERAAEAKRLAQAEAELRAEREVELLLQRAAQGDQSALNDAHRKGDRDLYHHVLQILVARADQNSEDLRAIAGYIVDSKKLRANADFIRTMFEVYTRSLDRRSLVEMVYLSALSDEAPAFEQAIEIGLKHWRGGGLPQVSPEDFLATAESAYWLLTPDVRSSGAGFVIKRVIANLRRELAAAG